MKQKKLGLTGLLFALLILLLIIGALFIYRYYYASSDIGMKQAYGKSNIVPVAVIGSGPAGLTAALYTARAQLPTVVFTGADVGGQLTEARFVENWPAKKKDSGANIMKEMQNQVEHFGAHLVYSIVDKVDFSEWPYKIWLNDNEVIHALSLIIASGGTQKKLDVPGVDNYWGKGIGVCTICDAPFDKGKEVAIVGSTDITCDMVLQLKEFAKHIYVCVPGDHMEAAAVNQKYLKESSNVTIIYNADIKEIMGNEDRLTGVKVVDRKTGKEQRLSVQSFYFAIGFQPNSKLFKGHLDLDDNGFIKVYECKMQTSKPLIHAAGTVIDPLYQKGLISSSMGAQAAIQLIEELQNHGFTDQVEKDLADKMYKKIEDKGEITRVESLKELKDFVQEHEWVLVEFYGENCPTCKAMSPILKELSTEFKDSVRFAQLNIQELHKILELYAIKEIPTFVLFRGAIEKGRSSKMHSKEELKKFIDQVMSKNNNQHRHN